MAELPALKKLAGTVETLVKVADGIDKYDMQQLNQAEDKVRNEFQVVEAALMYVGREFYQAVQARRDQLRRESIASIDDILNPKKKEEDGTRDSGSDGDSGVGDGADESSGVEQQSDKQTRSSAGRTRRKK